MANTPSAKKAARKIERRTEVNRARRSRVRTFLRKFEDAITAGDAALRRRCVQGCRARADARRDQGRDPQEHGLPQGVPPREPSAQAQRLIDAPA